jgi:ABC-type Fe3+/spermidine/putrescine transport system ATPase subunit
MGRAAARVGDMTIPLPIDTPATYSLCIRPEKWRAVSPETRCALTGRIIKVQYIGDRTEIWVDTPAGVMMVVEISSLARRLNDLVGLEVEPPDVKFLPA